MSPFQPIPMFLDANSTSVLSIEDCALFPTFLKLHGPFNVYQNLLSSTIYLRYPFLYRYVHLKKPFPRTQRLHAVIMFSFSLKISNHIFQHPS